MKHARAKLRLAIAVFLFMLQAPGCLNAQSTLSPEQTDRLYRIGQLWGHITYFHPYLQYKKINFDSAYAAAVPGILGAKTDAELVAVLNGWLGVLNDPITYVELTPQKVSSKAEVDFQNINGHGVLTLSGEVTDRAFIGEKLRAIRNSIEKVTSMVIDLSQLKGDMGWIWSYSGIERILFSGAVTTPGYRSVAHSGFVPEAAPYVPEYTSFFKYLLPKTIAGSSETDKPMVFLVSRQTFIPDMIWAVCKAGKAAMISSEPILDHQNASTYSLTENLTVYFRTREFISNNLKVDVVLANANKAELLSKAFEIIEKNKFQKQTETPALTDKLVAKSPNYPKNRYPTVGYRALAVAKMHSVIT